MKTKALINLFLLSLFASSTFGDPLDNWHWRNPLPSNLTLNRVTYANGQFVAVGEGGAVQTSPDGLAWTPQKLTRTNLTSVIFANGQFVAVGNNGVIVTSSDGFSWTNRNSGTTNRLTDVTFGNSTFLAVGDKGSAATSSDGATWTFATLVTNDLSKVSLGHGVFVVPLPQPGDYHGYTVKGRVMTSTDGVSWTVRTITELGQGIGYTNYTGFASVEEVRFANDRFLAHVIQRPNIDINNPTPPVRFYYSSIDGTNWSVLSVSTPSHEALYSVNDHFVERTNGATDGFNVSSDGVSWTTWPLAVSGEVNEIGYGPGGYVLVGNNGYIARTPDGTNATQINSGSQMHCAQITEGKGVRVVVGDSILISTNGSAFVPPPSFTAQTLYSVAFNGTNFVAVGNGGTLQRSTNGLDSVVRPAGTSARLSSVCYGSNIWVAVGTNGTIVTSADGLVWSSRASGTAYNLVGVGYGNGLFVAVGPLGTLLTSSDGITWNPQFVDTLETLRKVAYGNGQFVVVGSHGTALNSLNGVNWNTNAVSTSNALDAVTFGAGQFLAAASGNELFRSYDGTNWQSRIVTATYRGFAGVSFLENSFWLVGGIGTILQSDSFGPPSLTGKVLSPSGHFELTVQGNVPQNYRIQVRTNLNSGSWGDLMTITNGQSGQVLLDTNLPPSDLRFYRIISP